MDTLMIILLLLILAELTYILTKTPNAFGAKVRAGRPIFVDTSVLIDGRIIAVAQSGFISDTLMIPRSVIGELQFLADNADSEKRARARHGLDIVRELQALDTVKVEIFQDGSRAEEGVDERLLKLAKQHGGAVCTIDYNLNKVAQVEQIAVLNVNDLAMSLRMAYLPGEKVTLALTTKGNDNTQAVGHLDDGTMVVVEQAKSKIGSVVEVEVIRSLQTAAGKMMFARPVGATQNSVKLPSQSKPKTPQPTTPKGRSSLPKVQPMPKVQSTTPTTQPKLQTKLQAEPKVSTNSPVSQNRPANNANKANKGNHRNSRKGKSNEDSMVELANS